MTRRKNKSQLEWKALVMEYQSKYSNQSKTSYCRKKGVSATTFCKWYREFSQESDFVKVDIRPKTGYLKLFGLNLIKIELNV